MEGPPWRAMSRDWRAGVDAPEADTEGCRLSVEPAAAARSAEACDCPAMGTLAVLPACAAPPLVAETLVEGVGILLPLTEEEERCLLDGVG